MLSGELEPLLKLLHSKDSDQLHVLTSRCRRCMTCICSKKTVIRMPSVAWCEHCDTSKALFELSGTVLRVGRRVARSRS